MRITCIGLLYVDRRIPLKYFMIINLNFILFSAMFWLVKFSQNDSAVTDVIPSTWIQSSAGTSASVHWPPYKKQRIFERAVKSRVLPDKSKWKVRKMHLLDNYGMSDLIQYFKFFFEFMTFYRQF